MSRKCGLSMSLGRRHVVINTAMYIQSAVVCKEWNNQEIGFRKVIMRVHRDGWEPGKDQNSGSTLGEHYNDRNKEIMGACE